MSTPVVSRIAPTPSGYLHIGNGVNFLLTWLAVRLRGGRLHLRIDDLDRDRCKPRYVDDVFASLEWLGIEPDEGPSGTEAFLTHYSQTLRFGEYRKAMTAMSERGAHTFACTCSRKTLGDVSLYPGICRDAGHVFTPGETSMRIAVPEDTVVQVENETVPLGKSVGDFILWRRDGIPAYQLVSVVEDARIGVNLIVRGRDLFESSAAQLYLAPYLQAETFRNASFIHHNLILRADGRKFSKSDNDVALYQLRRDLGEKSAKDTVYTQVLKMLGLPGHAVDRPETLLELCRNARPESTTELYAKIVPR